MRSAMSLAALHPQLSTARQIPVCYGPDRKASRDRDTAGDGRRIRAILEVIILVASTVIDDVLAGKIG